MPGSTAAGRQPTDDAELGGSLLSPLLRWYDDHARDLPWRSPSATPWGVLVSEVMLQQTPVARVLPVWSQWLVRWPGPADLAAAGSGEAIRHWGRLGYPRRALRLHQAATAIVERHGGAVPSSYTDLLALPGIGSYTAAAVASFAFGARHAVVDTNVRRVQARLIGASALPAPTLTRGEEGRAEALLPDHDADVARWNVAVMELGALVCTARAPACTQCPLRSRCAWVRAGSPPYDGPPRRVQAWHGTDRQVRGRLLAAMRAADSPIDAAALTAACPAESLRDPGQRERALAGLIEDGLVEPVRLGRYRLPS